MIRAGIIFFVILVNILVKGKFFIEKDYCMESLEFRKVFLYFFFRKVMWLKFDFWIEVYLGLIFGCIIF